MSLADALLADFDGLSDDGGPSDNEDNAPVASSSTSMAPPKASPFGSMGPPPLPTKLVAGQKRLAEALDGGPTGDDDDDDDAMAGDGAIGFVPEGGVRPAEELDAEDVENTDLTKVEDVSKVSKLVNGRRLREVLEVGRVLSDLFPDERNQADNVKGN